MDTPKWQFVAITNKLLRQLKEISQHFLSLRKQIDQNSESILATYERNQKRNQESLEKSVVVKFTHEHITADRAANEKQYSVQKWIRNWTFAAAIAGIIYGGISFYQYMKMKEATDNARKAFEIEAEPHIVITNIAWLKKLVKGDRTRITDPIYPDTSGNRKLYMEIWYTNMGKTPALGVHRKIHVAYGKEASQKVKETFNANYAFPDLEGYPAMSAEPHQWGDPVEEPICRAEENNCIKESDIKKIQMADQPMFVYGIIHYGDIFHCHHATRFCYYQPAITQHCPTPSGCFSYCDFGNSLDDPRDIGAQPSSCKKY